jgi:hypothetical protein
MTNPKRTTNIAVMIEEKDVHRLRTSNISVMIEQKDVHRIRTSNIAIMIEYKPFIFTPRVLGPAIQNF